MGSLATCLPHGTALIQILWPAPTVAVVAVRFHLDAYRSLRK